MIVPANTQPVYGSPPPPPPVYDTIGGFAGGIKGDMSGPEYVGPAWFTEGMKDVY